MFLHDYLLVCKISTVRTLALVIKRGSHIVRMYNNHE